MCVYGCRWISRNMRARAREGEKEKRKKAKRKRKKNRPTKGNGKEMETSAFLNGYVIIQHLHYYIVVASRITHIVIFWALKRFSPAMTLHFRNIIVHLAAAPPFLLNGQNEIFYIFVRIYLRDASSWGTLCLSLDFHFTILQTIR